MHTPIPIKIELLTKSRTLVIGYADDQEYVLSAEYLRVYSPSAEVRGHGVGQEKLQTGKKNIGITNVAPVGNYGLKFTFDDRHDSGIYTWSYLHALCTQQAQRWQDYLMRLEQHGGNREA
jgi:DUF971 family protein